MRSKSAGVAGAAVAVAMGCLACSGSADPSSSAQPTVHPASSSPADGIPLGDFTDAEPGQPGCHPPSPTIGMEVMGSIDDGSLFGLVFVDQPITPGEEVKIVWRMTGQGDLTVDATLAGEHAELVFGPEQHGGSNWQRPGAEWGTGFVFPAAGCWQIRLRREDVSGAVWIDVKETPHVTGALSEAFASGV